VAERDGNGLLLTQSGGHRTQGARHQRGKSQKRETGEHGNPTGYVVGRKSSSPHPWRLGCRVKNQAGKVKD